jgi:hypothetical protein
MRCQVCKEVEMMTMLQAATRCEFVRIHQRFKSTRSQANSDLIGIRWIISETNELTNRKHAQRKPKTVTSVSRNKEEQFGF